MFAVFIDGLGVFNAANMIQRSKNPSESYQNSLNECTARMDAIYYSASRVRVRGKAEVGFLIEMYERRMCLVLKDYADISRSSMVFESIAGLG